MILRFPSYRRHFKDVWVTLRNSTKVEIVVGHNPADTIGLHMGGIEENAPEETKHVNT